MTSDRESIGQDVANANLGPESRLPMWRDAFSNQHLRDPSHAAALEVGTKDPSHHGSFLWDHLKIFLVYHAVAVGSGADDE